LHKEGKEFASTLFRLFPTERALKQHSSSYQREWIQ